MVRYFVLLSLGLALSGCGNGGRINFTEPLANLHGTGAPFNMVPGSQALAIENGKTYSTGYKAKLQLNPISGTKVVATSGPAYYAKLKFTTRNR